jgi:EmrB/QacA subfamily drug resistance transporter
MQSLDSTILNTAVPVVSKSLGVSPLEMRSVLASYALSLAVFIPISGWMADRFGTRRVFAWAIGVFTLASMLCGFCNDIHLLVACRVLQGFGGALMVPVGRLTLVRTFPKFELVRAMGFVSVPGLIGPMFGPVAGGIIVAYLNWRYIFFLNLPIGILGLILVFMYLPDFRDEEKRPLDIVGLIMFGCGIALLSYVLEVFGDHSLSSLEIFALTALSLVLLVGYVLYAARIAQPVLDLALFRVRSFTVSVAGGSITRLGMSGVPFLLPLLYQVGLGYTPIQSGLLIMPQALAALGAKFMLPPILMRFGYRTVLIGNTLMIGGLIISFATISVGTPPWVIIAQALAYGVFQSLQMTTLNTLAYFDISPAKASNASSISSTFQQLSISFAVAAAGLLTAAFIPASLRSNEAVFIAGIHEAFLVLGGFMLLSTFVFWNLRNSDAGADH